MNVIINGLALNGNFSGVQSYSEELVLAMNAAPHKGLDIDLFVGKKYSGSNRTGPTVKVVRTGIDSRNRLRRILFENFSLLSSAGSKAAGLYHSPGYVLPFIPKLPSIVTVHDLIAIDNPRYSQYETAVYHGILQKRSIMKAHKIIAVSHTVKRDIINRYLIDEQKIAVIYHGVKPHMRRVSCPEVLDKVRRKYSLPSHYILFVGNIEPKKNLTRLFKAFDLFKRNTNLPHRLVLVGQLGWKYRDILKAMKTLNHSGEIQLAGYVEELDLPSVYSMADLFVFPSLYEGFGIPPLEAMACETPVIVSNTGALPETTGGVAQQVDPLNVRDIAEKMTCMITNATLRDQTIQRGKVWVRDFKWDTTARKTIEVYEDVFRSLRPGSCR